MSIEKPIRKLGIAAIMLASSLTVMVGNAIAPALPDLGEVYHLGNYASWLVTAPALGVVSNLQPGDSGSCFAAIVHSKAQSHLPGKNSIK